MEDWDWAKVRFEREVTSLFYELDYAGIERLTMGINSFIERNNEIVKQLKKLHQKVYPNDQPFDNLKEITKQDSNRSMSHFFINQSHENLNKIRLNMHTIANTIGFLLPKKKDKLDFKDPSTKIFINQIQNQIADWDIKQVTELIEATNINNKIELITSLKDVEDEIKKGTPDKSKIKEGINKAQGFGKQYVVPLLFKILENWDKIFGK